MAAGREKRLYWHTTFGLIEVIEPLRRNGTGIERPFNRVAGAVSLGNGQSRVMT